MAEAAYDELGHGYAGPRRADPRIAARIEEALGDSRSVLNVGAGTGSYEPSAVMIAQRPPGSAPVLQAAAESLPLEDDSVDAAMAILSDHHWQGREAGLREMLRVARRRVLILNADPALYGSFWLNRDYLPGFADLIPEPYRQAGFWEGELRGILGEVEVRRVPVPHDCLDGFYQAYWRRPRAYLDPRVRDGTSVFHLLPEAEVSDAVERLRRDLESGAWEERYAELLSMPSLDVGMRLVVAELREPACPSDELPFVYVWTTTLRRPR